MIVFLLAVWALLLTPGPSNSLLALSGLHVGFLRSLRLLPAELCAYLLAVVPLSLVGRAALTAWPSGLVAAKLLAALWVLGLAVRHWSLTGPDRGTPHVGVKALFVTTLLNPKVLIFGGVLLPQQGLVGKYGPSLALFAASVCGAALVWLAGASIVRSRTRRVGAAGVKYLHRLVAAWLALLSVGLAGSALH